MKKYTNFTISNPQNKGTRLHQVEIDLRVDYHSSTITMEPIPGTLGWNSSGGFNIRSMSLDDLDILLDTLEEARLVAQNELNPVK